ncbi:MAG: cell division protein SepF [Mycobacteriaceae bacterium]
MSSLHKFKAYFGMVPTDDYDGYDGADSGGAGFAENYPGGRDGARVREPSLSGAAGRSRAEAAYDSAGYESAAYEPVLDAPRTRSRVEPLGSRRDTTQPSQPATRGSLAVDERSVAARRSDAFAEEGHPFAKITTLHPSTYNEARIIGERYREGTPVIMNLTEMSDSDAKRLVDFAAGLAFAMRGSIDKVTNKVFLLSPSNVDVSAEVKRHIVENGFYNHG